MGTKVTLVGWKAEVVVEVEKKREVEAEEAGAEHVQVMPGTHMGRVVQ